MTPGTDDDAIRRITGQQEATMNQFVFACAAAAQKSLGDAMSSPGVFPASRRDNAAGLNADAFVDVMKRAVTGVNVVTTDGDAGRFGLTVSAFASVSANPPLVLVCINRHSPACAAILENRRFAVNVLATGQQPIAENFAGMPGRGVRYEFVDGEWTTGCTGSPVLDGAVASFDCNLATAIDAGTHTIFTGLVQDARACDDEPLLYSNRNFGRIERGIDQRHHTRN
jgi:flavin reductase